MELIPVLSTIVLIATIMTFLLAIGAYILYKVRESRGVAMAPPQSAWVTAEIVTPAAEPQRAERPRAPKYTTQPVFLETQPATSQDGLRPQAKPFAVTEVEGSDKTAAKFMKYSSEGYVTPKEDKNSGALKWK
jgi:hypothetical protein